MDVQSSHPLAEESGGIAVHGAEQGSQEEQQHEYTQRFVRKLCDEVPSHFDSVLLPKAQELDALIQELQDRVKAAEQKATSEAQQAETRLHQTSNCLHNFHERIMALLHDSAVLHDGSTPSAPTGIANSALDPTANITSRGLHTPGPDALH